MNTADRIQHLRKIKGISQEELADQIGVSRQSVSKWESEQTIPDMDKIVLMSDYFEVTTDYILKGIEAEEKTSKSDARIMSLAGTMFTFIGLVVSVCIWISLQQPVSVALGLIIIGMGIMIHVIGQFTGNNKKTASKFFWLFSIWFIALIPYSFFFNLLSIVSEGSSFVIAPVPLLGNSTSLYISGWVVYVLICICFDFVFKLLNKKSKQ